MQALETPGCGKPGLIRSDAAGLVYLFRTKMDNTSNFEIMAETGSQVRKGKAEGEGEKRVVSEQTNGEPVEFNKE